MNKRNFPKKCDFGSKLPIKINNLYIMPNDNGFNSAKAPHNRRIQKWERIWSIFIWQLVGIEMCVKDIHDIKSFTTWNPQGNLMPFPFEFINYCLCLNVCWSKMSNSLHQFSVCCNKRYVLRKASQGNSWQMTKRLNPDLRSTPNDLIYEISLNHCVA